MPHSLQLVFTTTAWLIAFAWLWKVIAAARGLPQIPNLLLPQNNLTPPDNPSITVVVPARNEAEHIAAALHSLLAQDYPNLQIIAIDDRSTDHTGAIIDSLASQHSERLRAIHITELPSGWLGKTHAMALAASQSVTDYILFTDADVLFHPSAIRLSLANAVSTRADHLVIMPTTIIRRWDEAAILGFFQIVGLWSVRLWRISDPKSKRDALGIGAFNLLRRSAYLEIGGFEALRMEIVEDLGIGRRVKRAGLAQRVAFGSGLVSVHWASGTRGLVNVMTKNIFSAFRFYVSLLLIACLWLLLFCVAPAIGLFWSPTRIPSLIALVSVAYAYRLLGRHSNISTWNVLALPFSALVFLFILLRSMFITLKQGGVIWRGTFYSLAELRKNAAPLI
ncbi:glycosyltransferase [Granulicella sp. L60]|uniref:glycosyltransferase n=1 Tax=Granulicella sp. L60 TaxID=1641866 RepID=UPI00131EB02A|nr:glycosyltransferase [Granulicella sp. L60]